MFIGILVYTVIMCFTMIGFGLIFIKNPPNEINSFFGYRTLMSCKTKETWDFAHKYSGKVWIYSGIITAIISIPIIIMSKNLSYFETIINVLEVGEIGAMVLVIPFTEIALRKNFDRNGNKKNKKKH